MIYISIYNIIYKLICIYKTMKYKIINKVREYINKNLYKQHNKHKGVYKYYG